MIRKSLFIICLSLAYVGFSQDYKEVIDTYHKRSKTYNTYSVDVSMSLYRRNSNKKLEDYKGKIVKDSEKTYQVFNAMEQFNNANYYVKLNHEEKAIQVTKLSDGLKQNMADLNSFDVTQLLAFYEKELFTETATEYIITFKAKKINFTTIAKIEMHINKEDYRLKKGVIHQSTLYDFSNYSKDPNQKNDLDTFRIALEFSNYRTKLSEREKQNLTASRYFKIENKNIKLTPEFKGFELIQ